MLHEHPVVRSPAEDVFVSVVVKICDAHAPLTRATDFTQFKINKRTLSGLVQGVKVSALVKDNQIVKAIPIEVGKTNASTAVVFIWQEVVGIGERLGPARVCENTPKAASAARRKREVMDSIFSVVHAMQSIAGSAR